VPTADFRHFITAMRGYRRAPMTWFASVKQADRRKVLRRIRETGPLSIRDIDDDVLVDKDHAWASRKPSRRALQLAFFRGEVTVKERTGMLKTYELTERHFGWDERPEPARERETVEYLLDRSLRAQGVVSLDSICYMDAPRKQAMRRAIQRRVRAGLLLPVAVEGAGKAEHWVDPAVLAEPVNVDDGVVHILSPFDPLIIQRKRLHLLFDYLHRFEAYVPKPKRVFGYFALPVLMGDAVVAVIDLKTDRANGKLLMQQWTWIGKHKSAQRKARIEETLDRFARFQLAPGQADEQNE
jgi:uncharacterized protein YcaQ